MTFHLIPHTHWDREWYLPRAAFQARLAPVLDGVLHELEQHPDARFLLDGQTILLEDYLAMHPEQEARIAVQVRRGALEIGPWYVLADLQIPSAASLRRNLAEGRRDAARFGAPLDVLYSPDAFGHPAELPAIAAEFGIRRAVIRRGLGLPLDFYRWEGDGGASLLVHHLPRGGYDDAVDLPTLSGTALPVAWHRLRTDLLARAVTPEIAVFLGADHHAMVRDLPRFRNRLQAAEPEHRIRISSLTEYFDAVEATHPDPPVIRGERRRGGGHTWVLQDVLSARSGLKRQHGEAERALAQIAEPLARQAGAARGDDRAGVLRLAWRTLLRSQFHDTLAGSTCDDAQREQAQRLRDVTVLCDEVVRTSVAHLVGHDPDLARDRRSETAPTLVVWNPLPEPRSGIMTAEITWFRRDVLVGPPTGRTPNEGAGYRPFALRTATGEELPVQLLDVRSSEERLDAMRHYPDQDEVDRARIAFRMPRLEPGATACLTPVERTLAPADEGLVVENGRLVNRQVRVDISPIGELTITDLSSGERYTDLLRLTLQRDQGDLYTFSPRGSEDPVALQPIHQRVTADGPLLGAIETAWQIEVDGRTSILALTVSLRADSPVVALQLDLDSALIDCRLRANFPVGPGIAAAGTLLGAVIRDPVTPVNEPGAIEYEVRTAPAHEIVAAAAGSRGLAIASPGCFEYEWTAAGNLFVTLLRAVGELAREGLPERPGRAAWPMPTPLAQEQGLHRITVALFPVDESLARNGAALRQCAADALQPNLAVFLRDYLSISDRPDRS